MKVGGAPRGFFRAQGEEPAGESEEAEGEPDHGELTGLGSPASVVSEGVSEAGQERIPSEQSLHGSAAGILASGLDGTSGGGVPTMGRRASSEQTYSPNSKSDSGDSVSVACNGGSSSAGGVGVSTACVSGGPGDTVNLRQ